MDVTRAWIRNVSDERAAAAGCRFSSERGAFTVFWIERHCKLYEGAAGTPLLLRGCHGCGDYGLPPATDFDSWDEEAQAAGLERATRYADCVATGHAIDWQYECVMRLFGWERWAEKWNQWIRRFRKASIWVAKKNKKSPTLAAIGLYLLVGDGEPGQKVFLAAKDGTQARKIAGEHVVAMLEQSPELDGKQGGACSLNRNTMRVTYHQARSILEPLSSSNARTQESKEGLNGSVLIDETHVVDRPFVRRIDRAGISRMEPLHIEVSTAGNNPDGYGKERFDYASDVLRGVSDDQELFAAIYAAPQTLTDAELDADPDKYGRMANPAWGHTVDPEEFRKDYATSKRSIGTLLDFKMYRLNIWQRSANPWLRAGDWAACSRSFGEDDLAGLQCWAGLDLSRTRDMTALVLMFPSEDGSFRILPYFWLPEDRVQEISAVASVLAWKRSGHLQVTAGGVIDYGFVKEEFRRLAKLFNIQGLAYDPKFAEEPTQALSDGILGPNGKVLEEGTGVPRFLFEQSDKNFAAPTEDFERLVISGKMHHNDHPVMTWQVGHATVTKRPMSGVKRVMKPKQGDVKSVDGVVAAIQALAIANRQAEVAGKFYESNDLEFS